MHVRRVTEAREIFYDQTLEKIRQKGGEDKEYVALLREILDGREERRIIEERL